MIDQLLMQIAIVFYKFLNGAIQLIKMFCLKFLKINLNKVLKIIFFGIYNYIFIKLIYNVLIENMIVRYLNNYVVGKKDF